MSSTYQVAGHQLTLLQNGVEYFPALIEAMESAQHSIYLETYIFEADAVGLMVTQALQRAAQRGVSVHLLLDGFGSAALPAAWVETLRADGVGVLWFRQEIARFSLRPHRLRRLHRKLAVVDERLAFVGGINIISDTPPGNHVPRLDYMVRMHGPAVQHVHAAAHRLWALVSWSSLRRRGDRGQLLRALNSTARRPVSFLVRDNVRHRHDIEYAYLDAIAHAEREIIIANAYFLPGRKFRLALLDAARRGVRVVLLLQGKVEYRLQHYATLSLYDELLLAGIEIHEYHASFLHAKVAVVDGLWATVGSSNIDPFSLWLAREGNLVVRDQAFAEALRSSLMQQMRYGGRAVHRSVWYSRWIGGGLLAKGCYVLVRLLTGLVGYARGHDDV
ncbi:MAG: cardiolipin synthase ClsB [Nitrosomonadales bacterium]|nr:cardiolipin synthase ClsB [Nitrosomonadales bacterium]